MKVEIVRRDALPLETPEEDVREYVRRTWPSAVRVKISQWQDPRPDRSTWDLVGWFEEEWENPS